MHLPKPLLRTPGAAPGIEHEELIRYAEQLGPVSITCMDYNTTTVEEKEVADLQDFLGHHRPSWSAVRWINVEGLGDLKTIHGLATKYDLHPLAIEDLLHIQQRPKVEAYGGKESEHQSRLFIITRVPMFRDEELHHEQLSIFLGHSTILSFLGSSCDNLLESIRQRLRMDGSRIRNNDASFLAYALLDSVIDRYFPVLERYSDQADTLEDAILEHPEPSLINDIHQVKRDLLTLHRLVWPMREVVSILQRDPHECMSETTEMYLRDLYDHVIELIDIIETYREMSSDLTETYMSSISNRMNEIMKVLTLIGTIFLPLTFLAGVYGMNFHYLPELNYVWAYPAFWFTCIVLAVSMLIMFRRRKWL